MQSESKAERASIAFIVQVCTFRYFPTPNHLYFIWSYIVYIANVQAVYHTSARFPLSILFYSLSITVYQALAKTIELNFSTKDSGIIYLLNWDKITALTQQLYYNN